ncbi:MAG: hypothetical protein H8E35_04525 [Ardenticatenia bacterium]|nr:hypothetical protein [Ardenticatenia bacterium]
MDEQVVVVRLSRDSFQKWVREGILQLHRALVVNAPREWSDSKSDGIPDDSCHFYMGLPEKYGRALTASPSVYALIDEVLAISLPTEDRTVEWRVRMSSLGEGWLPFEFKPAWIEAGACNEPAPPPVGASSQSPPELGLAAGDHMASTATEPASRSEPPMDTPTTPELQGTDQKQRSAGGNVHSRKRVRSAPSQCAQEPLPGLQAGDGDTPPSARGQSGPTRTAAPKKRSSKKVVVEEAQVP